MSSNLSYIKTNVNCFFFEPILSEDVFEELKVLNNKKSTDYLGLSNYLLKTSSPATSISLDELELFNKMVEQDLFLKSLKIAKIVPLFKDGSKSDIGNYRPISLLPVIGKLFEKIIHRRIISFFAKHSILSNRQLGFLGKRSTVDAIIETFDKIISHQCKKTEFHCTLLDLSKAFDTVDHAILLEKCQKLGLRGKIHNLLKSYLNNRQQFVIFKNESSKLNDISCGVPQGSVLGPLLFLVYINDLPDIPIKNQITLFADDTSIFGTMDRSEYIKDLSLVSNWMYSNKLTVNESKTKLLMFNKFSNELFETLWNNNKVKQTPCAKHLGIWLDSELNFKKHVDFILKKNAKFVSILYQSRDYLSKNLLLKVLKQYVQPRYQYGILIYGTAKKSTLQKLQRQQNFLLRIIFRLKIFQEVRSIRQKHKIASIFELHVYELLKLMAKIIRNEHPCNFVNNFISQEEVNKALFSNNRIKCLPSIMKATANNKKRLALRVRNIFNIFVKLDPNIIHEILTVKENKLNDLIHQIRDNYVIDSDLFNSVFLVNVYSFFRV